MAVVVWWLLRQTVNVEPWVEQRPIESLTATARWACLR